MRTKVSNLVINQVPEFVRQDYPTFLAFIEAYYEYMESQGVNLLQVKDLDLTLDSFVDYFRKELAINLPKNIQIDERFLLQHIKDHYLSKGSEASFKLLFKLLYNKTVSVTYPGQQMLRASDGKWQQDISMFVQVTHGTPDLIDGKLVDVVKSDRILQVLIDRRQSVEIEVSRIVQISDNTYELFIDRKFFGNIAIGDMIRYKDIFSGIIVPTTASISISDPGTGFRIGQLFELKIGDGVRSILKITRVSSIGAVLSAEFIKFGIGYTTDFALSLNSTDDYYTSTNDNLLSTVSALSGAININESMRGFKEQGYINYVDYNIDAWEPTYVGELLREFSTAPLAGILVSSELPCLLQVKIGALAKYPGYYSSNDGFLNDSIYIQDSRYYQAYSYVLRIDERLASYVTAIKTMVHPIGTALFGEFEIQNTFDISIDLQSLISISLSSFTDNFSVGAAVPTITINKLLTDGITANDFVNINGSLVIPDEEILLDSGYVAKNPYSEGDYFATTPIIYSGTIDSSF